MTTPKSHYLALVRAMILNAFDALETTARFKAPDSSYVRKFDPVFYEFCQARAWLASPAYLVCCEWLGIQPEPGWRHAYALERLCAPAIARYRELYGCPPKVKAKPTHAGEKYGKLTVLGRATRDADQHKNAYWICQCDCGRRTLARLSSLRSGQRVSCGCVPRGRKARAA